MRELVVVPSAHITCVERRQQWPAAPVRETVVVRVRAGKQVRQLLATHLGGAVREAPPQLVVLLHEHLR